MANTFTTNYSLTKPEEGGANDQWGQLLNQNFDTLDSQVYDKVDKTDLKGVTHSLTFSGNDITTGTSNGFNNFVAGDRIFIANASSNAANKGEFVIENVVSDTQLDLKKADNSTDAGFTSETISSTVALVEVPKFTRPGLSHLTGEIRLFGSTSSSVINNLGSITFGSGTRYFWLACNGQAVSKAVYADLYEVLKNGGAACVFGESGSNFNLPDLRGRVPVGDNTMTGSAASRMPSATDAIGESGGAHEQTLGTANIPAHTHHQTAHTHTFSGTQDISQGNHSHLFTGDDMPNYSDITRQQNNVGNYDATSSPGTQMGTYKTSNAGGWSKTINFSNTTVASTSDADTGAVVETHATTAVSNLQPYLVIGSYIIAT